MKAAAALVAMIALLVGVVLYAQTAKPAHAPSPENSGESAAQGKLNIDVICDGALAYMTFPSGAEAEGFVQECKDGKHPEVIEKYKADMHLDDAAI